MLEGALIRTGLVSIAVATVTATAGCGGEDRAIPMAPSSVAVPAAEVELVMRPLSVAPDADPAPETAQAQADNVSLDTRLLVITANGTNAAFSAITSTLDFLGTPYDVLNATTGPALTADALGTADHGRYYGIILDTGDLAVSGASAFTNDEWMALASYEARFGVRRAVLYASPSSAYGLQVTAGFDVKATPLSLTCTTAGSTVFVGANCAGPVPVTDGWAYSSQPTDAFTLPLLVDAAGSVYAATRTYSDGREALVLTFAQSPTSFHTLELAYGVVAWVTRGLFIGDHHVYMSPQIDDIFLASLMYPGTTGVKVRINGTELQTFANWQSAHQADPLTAGFRAAFAFNAFGTKPTGQDDLSDKARALGPTFSWINHTWDHKEMDAMSYADAYQELSQNDQFAQGSGLMRYKTQNLVTPSLTGLDNPEAMRAAYDVGVRQTVSDSSKPPQNNPSPNAGYYNPQMPQMLMLPRHPTDLYFNVSEPADWIAEYAALNSVTATYDQLVATVSDTLLRYLLRGDWDPWMFHQANLHDIGGGHSMLSDLLDATFAKYAARATFPVQSPEMDELAEKVVDRMRLNAAGVSATIEPGAKLTVRAMQDAEVPVTGLCTPSAETYAGQQISYLNIAAGQSITLSLADCNPGATGTGGSGATGSGGASGGGGTSGAGGGNGGSNGWAGDNGNDGSTRGSLSTDGPAGLGGTPDAGGCGCSVPRDVPGTRAALGALLAVLAAAGARRRRRPRAR
jgi:MYXO-CTERM domain-containing protein